MSSLGTCFQCGETLEFSSPVIGRNETCLKCREDVRVCLNCTHYDSTAYNECHEPQAERVVDKKKANFCDYFSLGDHGDKKTSSQSKEDALKKLDDLFK